MWFYNNYQTAETVSFSESEQIVAYTVKIVTNSEKWAGTNSPIDLRLVGDIELPLNIDQLNNDDSRDILEDGAEDEFTFYVNLDVGMVRCIDLTARGHDAWWFTAITVATNTTEGVEQVFDNESNLRLSTDPGDILSEKQLKICDQGLKNNQQQSSKTQLRPFFALKPKV